MFMFSVILVDDCGRIIVCILSYTKKINLLKLNLFKKIKIKFQGCWVSLPEYLVVVLYNQIPLLMC